jgi:hypothetical protein
VFNLIDRLESLGRGAAIPLMVIGALFWLRCAWYLWQLTMAMPAPEGWTVVGMLFGTCTCGGLGMVFGMVGVRLKTLPQYPSVEEVFPSQSTAEFCAAVRGDPRPMVGCGECRILLPAIGDTGGCPRCGSAIHWYRVEDDADADLLVSVVSAKGSDHVS